ncbi:MAG: tetratricopeptide (TPR) repeat protein [Planctomycetota bacterium]
MPRSFETNQSFGMALVVAACDRDNPCGKPTGAKAAARGPECFYPSVSTLDLPGNRLLFEAVSSWIPTEFLDPKPVYVCPPFLSRRTAESIRIARGRVKGRRLSPPLRPKGAPDPPTVHAPVSEPKMRKVATALCLSTVFVSACATRSSNDGESDPMQSTADGGAIDAASADTDDGMSEQVSDQFGRLALQDQRKQFLVDQRIANAQALMDQQRLDEAQQELAQALSLDSDNLEVKQLMRTVGALMGNTYANDSEISDALQQQYELQLQQLRAQVETNIRNAKVHFAREDFDSALTELSLGGDAIRWNPYNISWDDLTSEIESLETDIRGRRDTAMAQAQAQAESETLTLLRAQEDAEAGRRTGVVNELIEAAVTSFRNREYGDAIDYSERALRLDPRNERAKDIRDTSFRQERNFVREEALAAKREQYKRWEEEIEILRVPTTAVFETPSREDWLALTELRARRPGLDLGATTDPGSVELRRRLAETTIQSLRIEEVESLKEVIESLRIITDLPFVVHPAAEDAALDESVVYNYSFTNPLSVERILNIITAESGETVTWTIRHDAIMVTTVEKARGELVIKNHDVQDLIFGLTDFLAPRINDLRLLDDIEDDDGGGLFGSVGERPVITEPDELTTLVTDNVETGSWDEDGIQINIEGGNMIVVHTPEVQLKVKRFLEDLRRFSSSLVTIESKFLTITDAFIQEVGVEFRGLDNPGSPFTDFDDLGSESTLGLDNNGTGSAVTPPSSGFFYDDGEDGDFKGRSEFLFGSDLGSVLSNIGGLTAQWTFLNDLQVSAVLHLVEKSQNIELVNDQVLSVHNTQRAYVSAINQQAYVQDFDVEVAQFQAVADPVINVLNEGIVLDVRPTINHNRRYITLEVQPTVARVVNLTDFTTTLAGQTAGVTFQLPELEVQSVFTTVIVPDGGSILMGGLTRIRNSERRAEVPWLANIPLFGFFFKEEGFSDEKESLMIMIRAWITDVKEELAALER